jgi:hypothetical protein
VIGMKQYKYQALLTVYPGGDDNPCKTLGPAPRRIVLRGHDDEHNRNQLYTALVSCDGDGPFEPGSSQMLVTLQLAGDDVPDYLAVGSHFDLWLGSDVGEGIITRRMFI